MMTEQHRLLEFTKTYRTNFNAVSKRRVQTNKGLKGLNVAVENAPGVRDVDL